jgi:hypothetical protein
MLLTITGSNRDAIPADVLAGAARFAVVEGDALDVVRALRQARAIDAAWALVRFELEVELGERRRVA